MITIELGIARLNELNKERKPPAARRSTDLEPIILIASAVIVGMSHKGKVPNQSGIKQGRCIVPLMPTVGQRMWLAKHGGKLKMGVFTGVLVRNGIGRESIPPFLVISER